MAASEVQRRFIVWLITPQDEREPRTQEALAAELGLSGTTLSKWKSDPSFLAEWNTTYLRTISSPETKMSIMGTLRQTATDPDDPKHVQAAKAYFEIEGSLRPKGHVEVNVSSKPVSELSDSELARLASMKAGDELAARRQEGADHEAPAV